MIYESQITNREEKITWPVLLDWCQGIWMSLTCIGAKSVAISRKSAGFREDSTDFELGVRGHFTDSCETMLVIALLFTNQIYNTTFVIRYWVETQIHTLKVTHFIARRLWNCVKSVGRDTGNRTAYVILLLDQHRAEILFHMENAWRPWKWI